MTRPVAWLNARVVDPASGLDAPGGLLVADGTIRAVGPDVRADAIPDDAERIDCAGRVLAPGLVDMRCFVGEPGAEHKETLASAGEAAAAGGVTTVITMPDTDPVIDEVALVGYVRRLARDGSAVRMHPMAALTQGLKGERMSEMGLLAEAGAVAFTDARRGVPNPLVMRRALSYASAFDLLICQYPEDPLLAGDGVMNEGEVAMRLGLPGIPVQAEVIMLERDIRLVELTGGRYHAATISAEASVEAVAVAKARDLPVTCAVAPHSFALNETAVGEYRTFAKTAPPLREEPDRRAIVEGLRAGVIDVICSSHDPQDPEEKRLPFEQAMPGVIGLETMLPLALELVHNRHLELIDALAKMTVAPADLLGLEAGRLAVGAPADLVLFDLDRPWRIDEARFRSKCRNAPYDGRPVQGQVWRTVVGGETVYDAEAEAEG